MPIAQVIRTEMKPRASEEDVARGLEGLAKVQKTKLSKWPEGVERLDEPGVYAYRVDSNGAKDLTKGLGVAVGEGLIYVGQTGGTKWPSGKANNSTLSDRIGNQHLKGNIRGSTFRHTLAAALATGLQLSGAGEKLHGNGEATLTAWMKEHLGVSVYPFGYRDLLDDLEDRIVAILDPPLNLDGTPRTPLRAKLSELRASLKSGARREQYAPKGE